MSSYEGGGFEEWVRDSVYTTDKLKLAQLINALESKRVGIEGACDDYDAETQSWRDYRDSLWGCYVTGELDKLTDAICKQPDGLLENFKLGLYRHTKSGHLYTVTDLTTHHETRLPVVNYVSHHYGGKNVRPLVGWPRDPDGFIDLIKVGESYVPRFQFVGALPCDTPIAERVGPPVVL